VEEYARAPADWPAMPAPHREFLTHALSKLRADPRLEGLAAGGSFMRRTAAPPTSHATSGRCWRRFPATTSASHGCSSVCTARRFCTST
jgi:hypothetical protein